MKKPEKAKPNPLAAQQDWDKLEDLMSSKETPTDRRLKKWLNKLKD